MSNLSKQKREKLLSFLNELKKQHDDDSSMFFINEIENELKEKKYGLIWEKHSEIVEEMLEDNIPIFIELKDKKIEVKEEEPYNFLLEGDNLHSLKLLEKTHKGKIDVIYIDPPYNTGNNDFVYDDNYIDKTDGYSHSKWLSFMERRLLIAKNLLSDKGIIFISIDDNELAQLKILCDDIFGEESFLSNLSIETGMVYGSKAAHIQKTFVKTKDYVLIYQMEKSRDILKTPLYDSLNELYDTHYSHILDDELNCINIIEYLKQDKKINNYFTGANLKLNRNNINKMIEINNDFKDYFIKNIAPKLYKDSQFNNKISEDVINKIKQKKAYNYDGKLLIKTSGSTIRHLQAFTDVLRLSDDAIPTYYRTIPRGDLWKNFVKDMGNVGKEGNISFINGKKPIRLIKQLIKWCNTSKSAIILDFFAGSGTTGHAVTQLNKEDSGNRKYILCTNNENNICEEITYQRLTNIQSNLPHNLKYFKTDFISKTKIEESVSNTLLDNIIELIELEYHIEIDRHKHIVVFDENDISETINNIDNKGKMFIASGIFLSRKEKKILDDKEVTVIEIPEYYFKNELREVGEI